jgi:hypothetical protein
MQTDACHQQRAALETALCVPVEAMNSSQRTSAVQVDEISRKQDEFHRQRAAGEGVNASIHGTTVAASPLLPQAQLLPVEEKPCAEASPPSVQRQGNLFTQRAACDLLTEACELLRRETCAVSLEQSRGSPIAQRAACELLREACELLQRSACELPPQHLQAQPATSESICAGSFQQEGLSRCLSQFRQPMSIGLGAQKEALPTAAQFSEKAEKKSKNQKNQKHQMPGFTGNQPYPPRLWMYQVASL